MARAMRKLAIALTGLLLAAPAAAGTFVYVHSRAQAEIFGFALARDGTLEALPGSPFATGIAGSRCGSYCQALAYSKRGRVLIAPGRDEIASLVVARDGTLSPAPGSPWALSGYFLGAAEVGNGKYVYVNDFETSRVFGFRVERSGDLSPIEGSPFSTGGDGSNGLSAGHRQVVAANESDGTLSAFRVGRGGVLTLGPNSPLPVADADTGFVYNVNVDRRGRFAYAGDCGSADLVHALAIDRKSAALAPLPASPFDTDLDLTCGGVALARKRAIALERGDEAQVFTRSRRHGSLEALTAPQAVAGGDSHAISRNGKLLLVADDGADTLTSYAVDPRTGALSELDQAAIPGARDANQTLLIRR